MRYYTHCLTLKFNGMKPIILGVFSSFHFCNVRNTLFASSYPFEEVIGGRFNWNDSIISIAINALEQCTKCFFLLDKIKPPIEYGSFTNEELLYIFNNPHLLKKITFMKEGQGMLTEDALKYLEREDLVEYIINYYHKIQT